MRRLFITIALIGNFLFGPWGTERLSAHAFPDHSDPRVGASIAVCPDRVRIWFDGALEPAFSTIMVHNSDGKMVDKGDGRVDPANAALLEVTVPPLPAGIYRVIWKVVARDGHRTAGDFTFTIK